MMVTDWIKSAAYFFSSREKNKTTPPLSDNLATPLPTKTSSNHRMQLRSQGTVTGASPSRTQIPKNKPPKKLSTNRKAKQTTPRPRSQSPKRKGQKERNNQPNKPESIVNMIAPSTSVTPADPIKASDNPKSLSDSIVSEEKQPILDSEVHSSVEVQQPSQPRPLPPQPDAYGVWDNRILVACLPGDHSPDKEPISFARDSSSVPIRPFHTLWYYKDRVWFLFEDFSGELEIKLSTRLKHMNDDSHYDGYKHFFHTEFRPWLEKIQQYPDKHLQSFFIRRFDSFQLVGIELKSLVGIDSGPNTVGRPTTEIYAEEALADHNDENWFGEKLARNIRIDGLDIETEMSYLPHRKLFRYRFDGYPHSDFLHKFHSAADRQLSTHAMFKPDYFELTSSFSSPFNFRHSVYCSSPQQLIVVIDQFLVTPSNDYVKLVTSAKFRLTVPRDETTRFVLNSCATAYNGNGFHHIFFDLSKNLFPFKEEEKLKQNLKRLNVVCAPKVVHPFYNEDRLSACALEFQIEQLRYCDQFCLRFFHDEKAGLSSLLAIVLHFGVLSIISTRSLYEIPRHMAKIPDSFSWTICGVPCKSSQVSNITMEPFNWVYSVDPLDKVTSRQLFEKAFGLNFTIT